MLVYVPFFLLTFVGGVFSNENPPPCDSDPSCPKNEHYTRNNSRCIRTCANKWVPICDDCKPFTGCVCKGNLVRLNDDGSGPCVPEKKCPTECGPNEVPSDCAIVCPPQSCESLFTTYLCAETNCTAGCNCIDGYLRDSRGVCIPSDECFNDPAGCNGDLNATRVRGCSDACPPTCENPNPEVCPAICILNGCNCKPGYIRSYNGGDCIDPKDCPVGCKGDCNATYKECTSMCPLTCAEPYPRPCVQMCGPSGCECNPGYVRNEDGKCIKPEDCPVVDKGCNGDLNATHSDCPTACPATCANRFSEEKILCPDVCDPSGCECKQGYILTEKGGICIKPEDCPELGCEGDPNAEYSDCPSACQATCKNPNSNQPCTRECLPRGCVCKPGFIRIKKGGKCIKPESCPVPGCGGDPNAVYSECPSACEPTCANPNPEICTLQCMPSGCVCKPGFVLNKKDGKCIEPENCPDLCKGDSNATFTECPRCQQATCMHPDTTGLCNDKCMPPGCVCKQGYLLNKKGGRCIKPEDCPGGWPTCRANETYVYCKVGCPSDYCPVDDSLYIIACDPPYPCPGGCACKEGYLMVSEEDDRCILSSECPEIECTRPNEVWDPHAPGCLHERCDDRHIPCDFQYPVPPRCRCIEGYYRNQDDICVPECQCPEIECTRPNEVWDPHAPGCLHERCDDRHIPCDFQYPGPPRCRCIEGYYRNQDDICVPECQCPHKGCKGDMNATWSDCPSKSPATCNDPDPKYTKGCADPGCVCNEGFIQSEPGGPCIRPYDCEGGSPHCCDNMTYVNCKIDCPMKYCPEDENEIYVICDPVWPCPSGCVCKPGYLMPSTADKTCILAADCPSRECTRPNEVWGPSPPTCNYESCYEMYYTCDDPNPGRPKCVCKEGYYKDNNGVCIPAEECPEPMCGYNEVAVPCRQICPPQNCEIAYTDYACTEESKICEPGCDCLPDHLRNGSGICIPNEQCPYPSYPVCGINEIARDCRRICPPQTCLSKYALFLCIEDLPCEPGCDCVPNYLRDDRGICIPSEQCPAPCQIPDECKRTCAEPNPPNCEYNPPKVNMNGCDCKDGYILSELGGDCILIEQCPPEIACHGDSNARPKRCPKPCPSTCKSPNQFPCKRMCEPIGCQCKPGYILSDDTGLCILPDECPGGDPCGENEHFVDCKTYCPSDYCPVDDNRDLECCDPPADDCLSGCICNINHRRKSHEDPICIVSSDCPQINCTRPNEEWNSCPSACLAEDCKDVCNQPTVCNTLVLNCDPRCICKKDHFRNSSGICIPAEDCPDGCNGDPNAVFSKCPSGSEPTCTNPNPEACTGDCKPPGCVCKQGFVLNEEDGKCIKPEDCPGCGGDPNAVYKECPSACEPTCANPNPQVCTDECKPSGCVCKTGFVLNEEDGKCVDPDSCPEC